MFKRVFSLSTALLLFVALSSFSCKKNCPVNQSVTVDFDGQQPNASTLTFAGDQGTFVFNSADGLLQTKNLPAGDYDITWNFDVINPSSCQFFLNDGVLELFDFSEISDTTATVNNVALQSNYYFNVNCR